MSGPQNGRVPDPQTLMKLRPLTSTKIMPIQILCKGHEGTEQPQYYMALVDFSAKVAESFKLYPLMIHIHIRLCRNTWQHCFCFIMFRHL